MTVFPAAKGLKAAGATAARAAKDPPAAAAKQTWSDRLNEGEGSSMPANKKTASVFKECVACGTCLEECHVSAISIYKGVRAVVDSLKCAGCGKCAEVCPAGVITVGKVTLDEKTLV